MKRDWNKPGEFNPNLERDRKRALAKGKEWTDAVKAPKTKQPRPEVPTFSECVIGYRVWDIDALGLLRPITAKQQPWQPGINEAECKIDHTSPYGFWLSSTSTSPPRPRKKHTAPHKDCHCGLYSRFSVADILRYEGQHYPDLDELITVPVVGAVAAWGTVQVHLDGMRSSHSCIVALAIEDRMPDVVKDLVLRVAAHYGVPAVPADMLALEASQHGTPLPESAKPERPKPRNPLWDPYIAYTWGGSGSHHQPGIYYTINNGPGTV